MNCAHDIDRISCTKKKEGTWCQWEYNRWSYVAGFCKMSYPWLEKDCETAVKACAVARAK